MKINEPNRITGLQNYGNTAHSRHGQPASAKRKDEVSISSEAMELLQVERAGGAERASKIEELRQSVSSGTYHVDAGKLADKLLPYLKNYNKD